MLGIALMEQNILISTEGFYILIMFVAELTSLGTIGKLFIDIIIPRISTI